MALRPTPAERAASGSPPTCFPSLRKLKAPALPCCRALPRPSTPEASGRPAGGNGTPAPSKRPGRADTPGGRKGGRGLMDERQGQGRLGRHPVAHGGAPGGRLRRYFRRGPNKLDFLHAVLCRVGMPRRRQQGRTFERQSGRVSLLMESASFGPGAVAGAALALRHQAPPRHDPYFVRGGAQQVPRDRRRPVHTGVPFAPRHRAVEPGEQFLARDG